MKRFCAIILMALVIGISGISAVESGLGVRGLLGVNWASGDDWDDHVALNLADNRPSFGFGGGAFFDIKFSDHVALGIEALYTTLSGKWENSDYYYEGYFYEIAETLTVPALQVPLTVKIGVDVSDRSSVYFFAGPDLFIIMDEIEDTIEVDGVTTEYGR